MNTKRLRTSVAAAMGGAVLLATLLVGASFAVAQETDAPEVTVDGESLQQGSHGFRDRAQRLGGDLEGIAEELGTTMEDLRARFADGATLEDIAAESGIDLADVWASLQQKALDAIDEKVAAGDLTQEQADSIKERIESFDPADGFLKGLRGFEERMHGFGDLGGMFGDLDVDLEELKGLLESGSTMDEALDSLGLDLDTIVADGQAAALAKIDELVADGTLTQERADQMKERINSVDLSGGLPLGFGDFRFDIDTDRFDRNGASGHHGHGFGFFDDDGNVEQKAEGALLDA